jgi:anti-sigma factor RsiW
MLMHIDIDHHIEEATLERYSMGSLADEAAAEVEQHLLLCEACQIRVTEADAYIRAVKGAVPELPVAGERWRWNFRLLIPAFAVCALLIATAVVRLSPRIDQSPTAVALFAMRGSDTNAQGPARRTLLLRPDLNGLPASPSYRLDVVDTSGSLKWRGVLATDAKSPSLIVPPQSSGVYFVRVSLPSGRLLREYALELRGRD